MDKTPLSCVIYTSPALSMFVDLELGLSLCLTLAITGLEWTGFFGQEIVISQFCCLELVNSYLF